MQTSKYSEEVQRILATVEEPEKDGQEQQPPDTPPPLREIDVYIEDDRITFIPKTNQQEQIIDSVASEVQPDSTPLTDQEQKPEQEALPPLNGKGRRARHTILTVCFYLFLILTSLLLQSSLPLNSPTATVTIIPKSQQITVTSTIQLGRIIPPITLTQSQTAPTTGKGHQDARNAIGSITFYNGELNSVTVAAGTFLTGANGIPIMTDQDAIIPPADPTATPPIFGQVTVSAHATRTGSAGNIPAYTIDHPCCFPSVIAKNTTPFHGGQDERNFQTVTKQDIATTAATLKTTVGQSMQAAIEAELTNGEGRILLPCTPTPTADHKAGEEATTVKVTASEICSAVAYNKDTLQTQVTALLTAQAINTLGTGYTLLGDVQVTVKQATIAAPTKPVVLSFSAIGTWVYTLTNQEQQRIKQSIAGKTKREALHILTSLPGIGSASIAWGDDTKLPEATRNIHLLLIFRA